MICVEYKNPFDKDPRIILCEKIDEYNGEKGTVVTLRNYIEIKGIPEPHEAELVWDLVTPQCGWAGIPVARIKIVDLSSLVC